MTRVMGLLPSLSHFNTPAHTSTCTAPSMTFFSRTYTFDSMCTLLEGQRALLSTIFSAMWSITALAMVLKA